MNFSCKLLKPVLAALLLASTAPAYACGPSGELVELLFGPRLGLVASAGNGDARFGSRTSADFALLFVNAGVDLDHATGHALPLVGVGMGHLLQLQYGKGHDEGLIRLRGEIPLEAVTGERNVYFGQPRLMLMLDTITAGDAGRGTLRFGAGISITLLEFM